MTLFLLFICVCVSTSVHVPVIKSRTFYTIKTGNGGSGSYLFNFDSDGSPKGWKLRYQDKNIPTGYKTFNHEKGEFTSITLDKYTNFTTPICIKFSERQLNTQPCKDGKYVGAEHFRTPGLETSQYYDKWTNCNFTNFLDYFGRHVYDPFTFYFDMFDHDRIRLVCLGNIEKIEECEKWVRFDEYQKMDQGDVEKEFELPYLCNF